MAQPSDDTPRESATLYISREQYESGEYPWDKDKKSKVLLFQFNDCKNKEGKKYERRTSEWEEHHLKECFKDLVGEMDFKAYRNRKMTELPAIFSDEFEDDDKNKTYNCFIFILLSVGEDDRIFCYDTEIPVTKILEPIKKKQSMALRPKIFFIQNGDERWIGPVKGDIEKGAEPVQFETRKVPQEADFFIMQSIIPESIFPDKKFSDMYECIFMTALIETVQEAKEAKEKDKKPVDIHKLSLRINAKVDFKLKSAKKESVFSPRPMHYDILPIPEVTSTLTKALYLPLGSLN